MDLEFWIPFGNGDGTFGVAQRYAAGDSPSAIAGDDVLDVIIANPVLGTVSVFRGLGDRNFEGTQRFDVTPNPTSLVVADLDGDHALDVVVGGQQVSVLLGHGDGSFGPEKRLTTVRGPIAVRDINGDKVPDIVAAIVGR